MSCKSLLALSLVGAVVLFLTGSASANPCPSPTPVCRPVYSPAPVHPPVCPGQLPELEPEPNRHTMTIFNGAHVVQQNLVEQNGSWRNSGEFMNYEVDPMLWTKNERSFATLMQVFLTRNLWSLLLP